MTEKDDVRDEIAALAQACLDHVRKVKWGAGQARYNITDGDVRLSVDISVISVGKAEKKAA